MGSLVDVERGADSVARPVSVILAHLPKRLAREDVKDETGSVFCSAGNGVRGGGREDDPISPTFKTVLIKMTRYSPGNIMVSVAEIQIERGDGAR